MKAQAVKKYTRTIKGQHHMERLVVDLIRASMWFEVMPMPDDFWQLSVREGEQRVLESIV